MGSYTTSALILLLSTVAVYSAMLPLNQCTCYERGSYYSPISDEGCSKFIHYSHISPPIIQICPAGTQFDVSTCVCNHAWATLCPANCPADAVIHGSTTDYPDITETPTPRP